MRMTSALYRLPLLSSSENIYNVPHPVDLLVSAIVVHGTNVSDLHQVSGEIVRTPEGLH